MSKDAPAKTEENELEKIWAEDKLGRIDEARHLQTFLINKYRKESSVPFVLNIDSNWGHGKTFFITRFANQLRQCGYPVVIFDAWKNDFSDEALLSFISAVCNSLDIEVNGSKAKAQVKKMRKFAKSLIKPSLPILFSILVKQLTGMSVEKVLARDESEDKSSDSQVVESIEELTEKFSDLAASKALDLYSEKKGATEGFTDTISSLVHLIEGDTQLELPIFIFVDELDRCRPSFSIELLEGIKHLFAASGVYFIVSTDSEQLSHSIKAIYGSDFNATRYLKRFFDMEYRLETPDTRKLSEYLFENSPIEEFFFIPKSIAKQASIPECFSHICDFFMLGARDVEQIFEMIKTVAYLYDKKLHLFYLMLIACLKHKHSDKMKAIQSKLDRKLFDSLCVEHDNDEDGNTAEYRDFKNEKSSMLSLRELLHTYIYVSTTNLEDTLNRSRVSEIQYQITHRLYSDNEYDSPSFGQPPARVDKTLNTYFGLLSRAGKFSSKLDDKTS